MASSKNELSIGLDANHQALLSLVALPMSHREAPWPVWDCVAREFERDSTGTTGSAEAWWQSMPTIAVGGAVRPYGLAWRSESGGASPRLEEQVGLSIAGLDALTTAAGTASRTAIGLIRIIRWLGQESADLESDPRAVVRPDRKLGALSDFFDDGSSKEMPIADDAAFDVLQREYCNVHMNRSAGDGPTVALTDWLRPLAKIDSIDAYLARASSLAVRPRSLPRHRPADLLLVLDYVSLAFAATDGWDCGPLFVVPDLQTAAAVGQNAHSEAEFRERMSALSALLKGMSVPRPSTGAEAKEFGATATGPINALSIWAEKQSSREGRADIRAAIGDIRSAIYIRVHQQHPTAENLRRSKDAHDRLGVSFPVTDWSEAWDIVRSRVADAFDSLRREAAISTALPR